MAAIVAAAGDAMTPAERQRIQDEIGDLAEQAKRLVRGSDHYRATVILRAPHLPDGDVVVSDDLQAEVLATVQHKWPGSR